MYSLSLKVYINTPKRKDLSFIWEDPFFLLKKAERIKRVTILKRGKDRLYTRWEVDVEGASLFWYEEDILDRSKGLISFKMQSGDFGDYFGYWRLIPTRKGKLKLELKANYDWGIAVLEPYVGKVLERKTKVMLRSFLKVIKKALEEYE